MDNKETQNFACINYQPSQVPDCYDFRGSQEFIKWGEDNKFPVYLFDNYLKNSNLQSAVNTLTDYIVGEGIDTDFDRINDEGQTLGETLAKSVFDYILFGGFCLEGIRNSKGEIVRLNYINIQNVRVNEELTTAYLSNNWNQWNRKALYTLPLYSAEEPQDHFIFYYRGNITRNINPVPIYVSSLKSIEILNQTRNFHLHNLQNNFTGSVLVALNNTSIKSSELREIKAQLEGEYTGTDNAGKVLIVNNTNADGKIEVSRLSSDNAGDLYKNLADSSIDDIFVAFRMNPILVGKNVATGFSKQEFQQAYSLFNATVITPIKKIFTKQLAKLGVNINFNELQINWLQDGE
jgi:capsid portal protein